MSPRLSAVPLVLLALVVAACAGQRSGTLSSPITTAESATVLTTTTPGQEEATTTADLTGRLGLEIVSRIPHSTDAFTQGFLLDGDRLFESTGLFGASTLREVDPSTGAVLRNISVDPDVFAEGLALVDDRLIQLTWQAGVATVFDRDSFEEIEQFTYSGEGWGLCHDGDRLVMSDGSSTLTMRDANTFDVLGTVDVTLNGDPLERINELECVEGSVWANVWQTDDIVRIDPNSGDVVAVVNAAGLHDASDANDVLNGIAYDDRTGEFLITGKRWPEMFRVRFTAS